MLGPPFDEGGFSSFGSCRHQPARNVFIPYRYVPRVAAYSAATTRTTISVSTYEINAHQAPSHQSVQPQQGKTKKPASAHHTALLLTTALANNLHDGRTQKQYRRQPMGLVLTKHLVSRSFNHDKARQKPTTRLYRTASCHRPGCK